MMNISECLFRVLRNENKEKEDIAMLRIIIPIFSVAELVE
jgi:hypothetical protein